jgi:type IV secretory pathway VirJ component
MMKDFVGAASAESTPLAPYLSRLPLDQTQCIHGTEEAAYNETSCMSPAIGSSQRIVLEGGHHFNDDYTRAAEAIWICLKAVSLRPQAN